MKGYLVVWLSLLVIGTVACAGNPFTEAGLPAPKDPGTVVVRVSDQADVAVANVEVTVNDIPNAVGSFYSKSGRTGAGGTVTIDSIDAGTRRVSMTVPTGFRADPEGSERVVTVIKDRSVLVTFRITRL